MFDEEGLNEPAEAVKVLQIVTAARPESASLYADLAEYAYKAHNTRIGDLASEKAVALAPAAQRKQLKTELAELKAHPSGARKARRPLGADRQSEAGRERDLHGHDHDESAPRRPAARRATK